MKTRWELQAYPRDLAGLGPDHHNRISLEASPLPSAFCRSVLFHVQVSGECPGILLLSFTCVIPVWSEKGCVLSGDCPCESVVGWSVYEGKLDPTDD